jgi:hypothetical protein
MCIVVIDAYIGIAADAVLSKRLCGQCLNVFFVAPGAGITRARCCDYWIWAFCFWKAQSFAFCRMGLRGNTEG